MYSESDIDAAVAAGALTAGAAAQFRAYVAQQRTAPAVDEEYFRLITGFNDIFVSIAVILVLVAVGNLCGRISVVLGGVAVAAASWALAEYFTRRRRMALPSIILLLGFVSAFSVIAFRLIAAITGNNIMTYRGSYSLAGLLLLALAAAVISAASYLHWRRFKVPITVAAGAAAAVAFIVLLLMALIPPLRTHWQILLFAAGIGVFVLALKWDVSDPTRTTRRSDVAFWLHLLAAPLIVHPIFSALGLLSAASTDASKALVAIGIYLVLAWVALLVDRRALLVSALGYVIFALAHVFKNAGAVSSNLALTALVVGSGLLLLSAYWHKVRHIMLLATPVALRRHLPGS